MKIILIFSCSGMFRNVPACSVFRVLSTAIIELVALFLNLVNGVANTCNFRVELIKA